MMTCLLATVSASDDVERFVRDTVAGRGALLALEEVQRLAVAHLSLTGREEVEGWSSRARLRGLVPRVEARFGTNLDLDVRDTIDDSVRWTRTEGQNLGFDVVLRFELGALVFSEAELRANRERVVRAASVRLARERVTRLYFDLLQVRWALVNDPNPSLVLKAEELAGLLRAHIGVSIERADEEVLHP